MPLRMQSTRDVMVDSWEIRIGSESIKHHFGRKVPIREAVVLARSWLDAIDKDYPHG